MASYADCLRRGEKLNAETLAVLQNSIRSQETLFGKGREEGHGCRGKYGGGTGGAIRENAGVLEDTTTKIDSTTSTDGGLVHELREQNSRLERARAELLETVEEQAASLDIQRSRIDALESAVRGTDDDFQNNTGVEVASHTELRRRLYRLDDELKQSQDSVTAAAKGRVEILVKEN